MRLRSRPVLCNYYVTYRCNAACGFCDIWERPSPYIKLEDVRQNLADMRKLGVKVVDFTGGEPLLHRDLHLFLKEARQLGMITTVTTNGLLYPKRAKELAGLVDMLHFSLDAATAEIHDAGRGIACFGKVLESIEIALELGERPDILYTFCDANADDAERVYAEICRPKGLMLLLNPMFGYNGVGDDPVSEETLTRMEALGKKPGVYLNAGFTELRRRGGNRIDDPVCRAGETTLVISPENKLVLPCYHAGLQEYDIQGKLHELWLSDAVAAEKSLAGRLEICEGCTVNCYMQPSMATRVDRYFWLALPSTLKYNWEKGTWKRLLPQRTRPAVESV